MAETLYYRGLVCIVYDKSSTGMQAFIAVPRDLASVLPSHETGYDLSQADEDDQFFEDEAEEATSPDEVTPLYQADTTIVDDLTTVLAYLQMYDVPREGRSIGSFHRQALEGYLLGGADIPRIALIIALISKLGLATSVEEDDDEETRFLKPVPNKVRRWLDDPRTKQVTSLITAWHETTEFNELGYLPHLTIETASPPNDPTLARQAVQKQLAEIKPDSWFSIESVVDAIRQKDPDFQRPAGDYDSWYIRDTETDEYLMGFEHWDLVDGGMLEGVLTAPMLWLGMADFGESSHGPMLKLTAYGKAYFGMQAYPDVPDPEKKLVIESDGTILISRHVSRYDRFQLARFTDWDMPGEPFEYRLSAQSLDRAAEAGIRAEHVRSFLSSRTEADLPKMIVNLLDQLERGSEDAMLLSRLVVLETATAGQLQDILSVPELRRFLGSRLGERAIVVREDQWEEFLQTLNNLGYPVEENL